MAIELRWAAATHTGCVRSLNEDSILAGPTVFAVADGMGGHAGGQVASAIAVAQLAQVAPGPTQADLLHALTEANHTIRVEGRPGSGRQGMGTTVTGLALAAEGGVDRIVVFNVGDSRTYLSDGRGLEQISTDHSVVAELVASGELTAEEADSHPSRHVVTRALGADPDVVIDWWVLQPSSGVRFLLCSDGLTNEIDEVELARVLDDEGDPQAAVDRLMDYVLDAGARDNVSIVLVQIEQVISGTAALDEDTNPRVTTKAASDAGLIVAVPNDPGTLPVSAPRRDDGNPDLITGVPSWTELARSTVGG